MRRVFHGGLTPPALGCMYGRRCRWAILAEENDTGRTEHWCLARLITWIRAFLAEGSDTFPTGGLRPLARCRWAILAASRRGAYAPRSWRCYNDRVPEEWRFLRCTNAYPQDGADGLYVSPSFVSLSFSSVERPSDGTHRACDVPWPLNRPD
jgi:hypothetical protein